MASCGASLQIQPGKGLGFLSLGAALHDVLTRLRAQSAIFPSISIAYSQKETIRLPILVTLSQNGIRLRFDGPEQRLRLIEIVDFSKLSLSYKNTKSTSLTTLPAGRAVGGFKRATGPTFRQIYDIFSVTFPGEYFPAKKHSKSGTYVLSYPGLAFSFQVEQSAWSSASESDFVKVLSSSSASPACGLAIYNGGSWKEARRGYLTETPPHPRSLGATTRAAADDVEMVKIKGKGRIQIQRRFSRLDIVLGKTTPQDVVAALGPPDFIYRKHDWRFAIHKRRTTSAAGHQPDWHMSGIAAHEDDQFSAITDDSFSDDEPAAAAADGGGGEKDRDCFYNYFRHGFDVYLSDSTHISPPLAPSRSPSLGHPPATGNLVVTKLILYANVPGSYAFNRYRRCRWVLDATKLPSLHPHPLAHPTPKMASTKATTKTKTMKTTTTKAPPAPATQPLLLTSEARFSEIGAALRRVWAPSLAADEEQRRLLERPMVLNRGWADSPGSSCELLGELDDSDITLPATTLSSSKMMVTGAGAGLRHTTAATTTTTGPARGLAASVGDTRLYGFPGLLFEVLRNDTVSCLTIY